MTDNELDQLMQRVLLDAIKSDCEKENGVAPSFEPSLRYQRSLAAMIADPLKWAHKRTKPLWKKVLQKVAIVLIVFSLSLGSLMAVSPNIRAAVVNWVTEWYETHITFRYLGTPTEDEIGNVKKCAVGKHPKSEKHGNTAQFSEVERSGTQENCGGIGSGCRLRLHPLPVLRRRQSHRVACIDPDAVVVDKNIAKNDRFDLFSR